MERLGGSIPEGPDEHPVSIAKLWFETQGFHVDTWREDGQWIARARVGNLGEELVGRGDTEGAAMSELQRGYRPANTGGSKESG
jgi:hypothetical protein